MIAEGAGKFEINKDFVNVNEITKHSASIYLFLELLGFTRFFLPKQQNLSDVGKTAIDVLTDYVGSGYTCVNLACFLPLVSALFLPRVSL